MTICLLEFHITFYFLIYKLYALDANDAPFVYQTIKLPELQVHSITLD